MNLLMQLLLRSHDIARRTRDERGLATAELLGNAALGIVALVAIWAALRTLGLDIVSWIRGELLG